MMSWKKLYLVLLVNDVCGLFTPVVKLQQGLIRGTFGLSGQKRYFGIPYATAKRFQPPKPGKAWTGVFKAALQFDSCAQAFYTFRLGNEDCLLLDVYTPKTANAHDDLPVLVYFHGGAYYFGAKWQYDPEYLVAKDVIVVVVNYRLGVFGFLCLSDIANLGLKDQLAALKWIRKNIAAFGGDPDNVTISGQSAGSTSSAMHMMSKKSRGLFHKAILMSGVPLTPWAFNLDPLTPAFEDAAKLGPARNEYEVLDTFMRSPVEDILSATLGSIIDTKYFKYSPCVDANHTDPFFHDTPYNIITSGDFTKVPTIIGTTNLEGLFFYALNNRSTLNNLDYHFPERLPTEFSWCSEHDRVEIANMIKSYYVGNHKMSSRKAVKGMIDLYSDWAANAATGAFSRLLAAYSEQPVYNYVFAYEGNPSYFRAIFNTGIGVKGDTHTDDVFYAYKPLGITDKLTDMDRLTIDRFSTLLTNFMKYGDPTPFQTELLPIPWLPTTGTRSQVLYIDRELSMIPPPVSLRGEFFLSLLCQYGMQGYVPCDSAMECNIDQWYLKK